MGRSLPYRSIATLHEQDGTDVAVVPCSIWPSSRSTSGAGEYYDHTGEAALSFYDLLTAQTNRRLELDGERFQIMEVVRHTIFPHLTLRLRRRSA